MGDIKLTWLGHSCFRIDVEGTVLLIDPFINDNPVATLKSEDLYPDIIAVTHGHRDHLGDTVEISKRSGCKVVCIHELSQYLRSKGISTEGMNIGGSIEVKGIRFTMTDALHSSSIDEACWDFDGGKAAGFIVSIGNIVVYHAGDTGLFGDMKLIAKLYSPDVALLPIGGRYTMDSIDAALAVGMLHPDIAIPMHYNTFDVIEQDPIIFEKKVRSICDTKVMILNVNSSIFL